MGILDQAFSLIPKQDFTYFAFDARTTNSVGVDVSSYLDGVETNGSVQPVKRSILVNMGLDYQRDYKTVWVSKSIIDIDRDVSGDQIEYGNRRYQCLSKDDWFLYDGWVSVMCVAVPDA